MRLRRALRVPRVGGGVHGPVLELLQRPKDAGARRLPVRLAASGRAVTLAEELHQTWLAHAEAEARLGGAIDEVAPDAWDDFTTDWYDNSVEGYMLGEIPETVTDAVAAKMFSAGFGLCWVHPHKKGPRVDCKCPVRRPRVA